MSSPRTPHRAHAMTKGGQSKVTFNLAAPFFRVRSGKPQRLRYTALNGTSSSARGRQPPEPECSIRVPGHVPVTRIHRDSSRCLARALAPPVCDTLSPCPPSQPRPLFPPVAAAGGRREAAGRWYRRRLSRGRTRMMTLMKSDDSDESLDDSDMTRKKDDDNSPRSV